MHVCAGAGMPAWEGWAGSALQRKHLQGSPFGAETRSVGSLVSLYEEWAHALALHLAVFAQQWVPAPAALRLWQLWGVAIWQDPPYIVRPMQVQNLRRQLRWFVVGLVRREGSLRRQKRAARAVVHCIKVCCCFDPGGLLSGSGPSRRGALWAQMHSSMVKTLLRQIMLHHRATSGSQLSTTARREQ